MAAVNMLSVVFLRHQSEWPPHEASHARISNNKSLLDHHAPSLATRLEIFTK